MSVPVQGTRSERLDHLLNTVAGSATFQKLVGAADATAAKAHIFKGLALDDGTQTLPRCIIRANGAQTSDRMGYSWTGKGEMLVFVQMLKPSQSDLETWYTISGPFSEQEYRLHLDNVFGLIGDEMRDVATQASCLEFARLEEFSMGEVDPVTENGKMLVEMIWVLHREGLP